MNFLEFEFIIIWLMEIIVEEKVSKIFVFTIKFYIITTYIRKFHSFNNQLLIISMIRLRIVIYQN